MKDATNGVIDLPMRGMALMPSTVSKTLICVDEILNHDIVGTCYNLYMKQPYKFASVLSLVKVMENFFDAVSFPYAYYASRMFDSKLEEYEREKQIKKEVRQYMSDDIFETEQGKKATFVVQVQFRQNATWQGTITWTEEKKTQRFRSTLEMIKLMDSAFVGGSETGQISTVIWE